MGKTIEISLTSSSINKAIREVKRYQRELNKKMDEVAKKTAKYARDDAQEGYNSFYAAGAGNIDVEVQKRRHAYAVHASGRNARGADGEVHGNRVIFAEFGTGVFAGDGHPLADSFGAYPGSWSSTFGTGEFAENYKIGHGYWHYQGNVHFGYIGTRAMYNAGQRLSDHALRAIDEVFK